MRGTPNKSFYFFDEARFGTHSKLGHGWFPEGKRTTVKVKLGFKNFYVYSAVDVSSGEDFSLIMPKVNTHAMNAFLDQMSKSLGDKEAVIVMDCAGWHTSKRLEIPTNIEIIFLPPYSPELNPVEKLWQYIKAHTIKNVIYESLSELEGVICEFITNLKTESVALTCSLNHSLC